MLFAPGKSMTRDLSSAYAATGAKMLAWFTVAALVYRLLGADYFAMLALVRATIGLLNYTTLGLSPAMVHYLSRSRPPHSSAPPLNSPQGARPDAILSPSLAPASSPSQSAPLLSPQLEYARPDLVIDPRGAGLGPLRTVYSNGLLVAGAAALLAFVGLLIYATHFAALHEVHWPLSQDMPAFVLMLGAGTILRLFSDASGAVLQIHDGITLDNLFLAGADLLWAALCALAAWRDPGGLFLNVAAMYVISGAVLLTARLAAAAGCAHMHLFALTGIKWSLMRSLLAFGLLVTLAQLADYLYAPTDYILISRLLSVKDLAAYAPAVQVDAALLLLVTGLSAVLLPKSALAHAAGDTATVRRYYLRGTGLSLALLAGACGLFLIVAPGVFRLWFGDTLPATCAILPLVLIHTLVGGSSAVGRSILLGTGHVKPFTASVLVAGVGNVALSYLFVRYGGWGLSGIILGTIIAVTGRCAIWMPWYTLRALGRVTRS
jgi:O-antigen/teichoic acid export membrane protein